VRTERSKIDKPAIGRSDLSRLLFEKAKDTTEVVFDGEIVGLQEQAECVR